MSQPSDNLTQQSSNQDKPPTKRMRTIDSFFDNSQADFSQDVLDESDSERSDSVVVNPLFQRATSIRSEGIISIPDESESSDSDAETDHLIP